MAKAERYIFHIADKIRWAEAQAKGEYTPSDYEKEGFIHLSSKHQLRDTAEKYYKRQAGLAVLKVNISRLNAPLKYENLSGGDKLFPHLYGPLNIDAVTHVAFLGLTLKGEFLWPDVPFK